MYSIKVLVKDMNWWNVQRDTFIDKMLERGFPKDLIVMTQTWIQIPCLELRVQVAFNHVKDFRGTYTNLVLQQPNMELDYDIWEYIYFRCDKLKAIHGDNDLFKEVIDYVKNNKEKITKTGK